MSVDQVSSELISCCSSHLQSDPVQAKSHWSLLCTLCYPRDQAGGDCGRGFASPHAGSYISIIHWFWNDGFRSETFLAEVSRAGCCHCYGNVLGSCAHADCFCSKVQEVFALIIFLCFGCTPLKGHVDTCCTHIFSPPFQSLLTIPAGRSSGISPFSCNHLYFIIFMKKK